MVDSPAAHPYLTFASWFSSWEKSAPIEEPNRVFLSTASGSGVPSGRIVLLKQHSEAGLVFFTNYNSRKGQELRENPRAALCFDFFGQKRQVRAVGNISFLDASSSNAYWQSRSRKSQLSGAVSKQSRVLKNRDHLRTVFSAAEQEFSGKDVPRPEHWGGVCLAPTEWEFWEAGEDRLHHRVHWCFTDDSWVSELLYP